MKRLLKMFRKNITFTIGVIIVLALVICAVFCSFIAPYPYLNFDGSENIQPDQLNESLLPPSKEFPLGTDKYGHDLLSVIIYGAQPALKVCLLSSVISVLLGLFFGLTSGYYYGSRWDTFVQFLINVLMSIPGLILAVALVAFMGRTMENVIIAFAVIGWTGIARLVRAKTQVVINMPFVEAARAFGENDFQIIMRYVLPNIATTIIVMVTMSLPGTLIGTTTLSFLGIVQGEIMPSWGTLVSQGLQYLYDAPWLTVIPGLMITITAVGINFFGEGLRDYFDANKEV